MNSQTHSMARDVFDSQTHSRARDVFAETFQMLAEWILMFKHQTKFNWNEFLQPDCKRVNWISDSKGFGIEDEN